MGSSVTAITASRIRCGEEHGRYGLQLGVLYRPRGQHEWSKDRLAAKPRARRLAQRGTTGVELACGLRHQTERNACGARKTHWTLLMFPRSRRRRNDLARRPGHKPLTLQKRSPASRRFVSGAAVAACRDWPAIPGIRGRAPGPLPAGRSPAPQARTAWHSTPRARQARCGRPNPGPP
jgi:hypothetical protein